MKVILEKHEYTELKHEMKVLREKNKQLKEKNKKLNKDMDNYFTIDLQKENKQLKKRIKQFELLCKDIQKNLNDSSWTINYYINSTLGKDEDINEDVNKNKFDKYKFNEYDI